MLPVLLMATLLSGTASAQPSRSDDERANELFDRAEAEWQARRLSTAADLLRQSLELRPRSSTAFNLAAVLHETGRIQEAGEVLDGLLEGQYGELDEARRVIVQERRQRADADLVTVRIHGRGPGTGRVFLDGGLIGELQTDQTLVATADPGAHLIAAVISGSNERLEERVRLGRGEVEDVSFDLPLAVMSRAVDEGEPSANDSDFWASPILWIAVGAVVAGAGIATAVYYGTREPDRVVDPVFGDAATLSIEF